MTAGRPRAQDIDRHLGARLRELRVAAGLSQQVLAELVGVTCQQVQKYEAGANRIAAGRLYALAAVLEVDVGTFFDGLAERSPAPLSDQRVVIDLARHFRAIRDGRNRALVCQLAAALSGLELEPAA